MRFFGSDLIGTSKFDNAILHKNLTYKLSNSRTHENSIIVDVFEYNNYKYLGTYDVTYFKIFS